MRMLAGVAICLVAVCSGCGPAGPVKPKLYPVTGKVTVAGKPLTDCTITFTTPNPAPGVNGYQSELSPAGEYDLVDSADRSTKGAAAGKYKVIFTLSPDAAKKAMMAGPPGPGAPPAAAAAFPPEYGNPQTSPKEVEVKAESNVINIDI